MKNLLKCLVYCISVVFAFLFIFRMIAWVKEEKLVVSQSSETQTVPQYDILQQMFLNVTEKITVTDIKRTIEENHLFYAVREYNDYSPEVRRYESYIIAYKKDVAKHFHGMPGDYFEIEFAMPDGNPIYACYYSSAVHDYKKNFEAEYYLVKAHNGNLGYYGHNADFGGHFAGAREVVNFVPFATAEEALANVLNNAK